MLAHIYETLELRVGMRLADQMSDSQLDEFEGFIDRNDESGALKWLESNFPHYKDVVGEELDKIKSEIRGQAPEILRATMDQLAAEGGSPSQPPAPSDMPPPSGQQPPNPS
jgi:hypothetical protein